MCVLRKLIFNSKLGDSLVLKNEAQRPPYWTFKVGRSMFDVHWFLFLIKPAAVLAGGPPEVEHPTPTYIDHTRESRFCQVNGSGRHPEDQNKFRIQDLARGPRL